MLNEEFHIQQMKKEGNFSAEFFDCLRKRVSNETLFAYWLSNILNVKALLEQVIPTCLEQLDVNEEVLTVVLDLLSELIYYDSLLIA